MYDLDYTNDDNVTDQDLEGNDGDECPVCEHIACQCACEHCGEVKDWCDCDE
jgi:hypothetical protein